MTEAQGSDEVCATTQCQQDVSTSNEAIPKESSSLETEQTPQSREILQTVQNLITSSSTTQSGPHNLVTFHDQNAAIQAVTSGNHEGISQEVVTTSTDAVNSQPQTLYVAIQPQSGGHNNGDVSEDQPAVYLEVVEASNLSDQITSEGQVLEGQMIIEQASSTSNGSTGMATSLLSQVLDQATLSTMQAEMIAVQVLSQSATGDVQFFQQQPNAQIIPVSSIASADLQSSLTQASVGTLAVTVTQPSQVTSSEQIAVVTTTSDAPSISQAAAITGGEAENQATGATGEEPMAVDQERRAEDAEPGEDDKPKYTCEICGKAYIRSWSYYGHMREHASGEKQHKCDVCEKVFNYASNLRQHMLIHTGEKPYECEYCDKAFNNPSSLRSHMLSHSEEKPYSCDQEGCDKAFNNPGSLRVHRRVHQEEKPYVCAQDDCDKAFKTPAELARHMFRHTGSKPHKCDQCDKAFIRYDDLKRHYRIHTGEKPFKCDQCDFACIQSFDLVKHKYTHSGDKPYKCELCTKQFTRPARLRDHMRTHTGEKPFMCEICGKSFSVQTGLKSHMAVHTGEKPFKCNECERSFRTQQELQSHMGRHTGIKPFKCDLCQKEFISAVTFKRHAIVHSGEKPYQCEECGRKFARSTDLKVHLPVHSDDKPYKCGECEKMFTRFSTLKEHIRTHTGERPFKCDSCGRQFNHRSHFNNHLRIHTGEKPFKCEKCGKLFSRKASVRYHMKVHGTDSETSTTVVASDQTDQQTSTVDHEQVAAGQMVSQLTNEADVQLAEVLVAVSDALVAANQEQAAVDGVHLIQSGSGEQINQESSANENVQILETSEQQGIETDMNADQTVPIIANEESASNQMIHNSQVLDANGQLTEAQIMQVSGITSVETSDGHVITVNVSEDGQVIDPSQLHALSVIAEAAKANQIQIPDILAASGVGLATPDDIAHIVAVSDENGQQAHVAISQAMQQEVVTGSSEEQPMETS